MASHFTGPVLHAKKTGGSRKWYSTQPLGSDPDYVEYFNDFLAEQDYAAADWTVTEVGLATQALTADDLNGSLLITNAAADNDSSSQQLTQENWALASGKQLWMEMRVKVADASQVDMFVGLGITDTTPLDTTDRAGFQITDESASILSISEKNSTETSTDTGKTASDATYVKLGMWYDGKGKLEYYVDRSLVATHNTNIPDDENMAVTLHVQNGQAVANTLTVDYIYIKKER